MPNKNDFIGTKELRALLDLSPPTVTKCFQPAYFVSVGAGGMKLYRKKTVAEIISAASGFPVEFDDLYGLISIREAMQLLEIMGKGRSRRTWSTWREKNMGPRYVLIGGQFRLLRNEVLEWAEWIEPWQPNIKLGPNGGIPSSQGDVGGSVPFSLSPEVQ